MATWNVGLIRWGDIKNEQVVFHEIYKVSYYEFSYDYPSGKESINLSNEYINHAPLMHMLYVYRNRSKKLSV